MLASVSFEVTNTVNPSSPGSVIEGRNIFSVLPGCTKTEVRRLLKKGAPLLFSKDTVIEPVAENPEECIPCIVTIVLTFPGSD